MTTSNLINIKFDADYTNQVYNILDDKFDVKEYAESNELDSFRFHVYVDIKHTATGTIVSLSKVQTPDSHLLLISAHDADEDYDRCDITVNDLTSKASYPLDAYLFEELTLEHLSLDACKALVEYIFDINGYSRTNPSIIDIAKKLHKSL